jgi:hypothetical protein
MRAFITLFRNGNREGRPGKQASAEAITLTLYD